jgi:hypothetical protein
MTVITTHLSISTLNVNGLNSPIEDSIGQSGLKRKIQQYVDYKRPISSTQTSTGLGLRAGRKFTKPTVHKNRQG